MKELPNFSQSEYYAILFIYHSIRIVIWEQCVGIGACVGVNLRG